MSSIALLMASCIGSVVALPAGGFSDRSVEISVAIDDMQVVRDLTRVEQSPSSGDKGKTEFASWRHSGQAYSPLKLLFLSIIQISKIKLIYLSTARLCCLCWLLRELR